MKDYTDETIRFRANESMLASKGFILCCVLQDGSMETIGDTSSLTTSEKWGLEAYYKSNKDEG